MNAGRTCLRVRAKPLQAFSNKQSVGLAPLTRIRHASSVTDSLPRVAQPSLWQSMIPKPLRRGPADSSNASKHVKSKEWNPATFYIVMFLLIGSNAINMIALRRDYVDFSRRADQQIQKLREVIEMVQQGKEVDVEAMLGTGDPEREQEWEEILREIEKGDIDYVKSKKDRKLPNDSNNDTSFETKSSPKNADGKQVTKETTDGMEKAHVTNLPRPSGFY